jgi:hypothetical protein
MTDVETLLEMVAGQTNPTDLELELAAALEALLTFSPTCRRDRYEYDTRGPCESPSEDPAQTA